MKDQITRMVSSCFVLLPILAFSLSFAGAQTNWAVWKHNTTSPGEVAVAQLGSLKTPWAAESVWKDDLSGALKKACWLVKIGDLAGRGYRAPQMESGQITCDTNCNCRF